MSIEAAFLAAIRADPDDDAPRLIYSDWLDQQGRAEQAEFIRVQCELAQLESILVAHCKVLVADQSIDPGRPDGHENERIALRRRERALLECGWVAWHTMELHGGTIFCENLYPHKPTPTPHFTFRRGFVHAITCTAADWLTHADAILAAQPVEEVTLTTDDELIEMDAAVRAYRDGTPSVWTMRRWPRIKKWTLPQAEPIYR